MLLSLPTGRTISISVYEFLFLLKDEDVDEFYQTCVADNLGSYTEDPFAASAIFESRNEEPENNLEDEMIFSTVED